MERGRAVWKWKPWLMSRWVVLGGALRWYISGGRVRYAYDRDRFR